VLDAVLQGGAQFLRVAVCVHGCKYMPLTNHCEACGRLVLGFFSDLRKVDGKFMCKVCASNAEAQMQNPNLTKCGDCGGYLSVRATACPNCGAPRT
jgi:rubrerythrin